MGGLLLFKGNELCYLRLVFSAADVSSSSFSPYCGNCLPISFFVGLMGLSGLFKLLFLKCGIGENLILDQATYD